MISSTGPAEIQGLIDWQGAWTAPYCMQATFPIVMEYNEEIIKIPRGTKKPVFPDDIGQHSPEEQANIRLHHRYAMRHKAYELYMALDPRRAEVRRIPHLEELVMLPYRAARSWSDGLVLLRQLLWQLSQKWEKITLPGTRCPIHFPPDVLDRHCQEFANFQRYQESFRMLCKLVGAGGFPMNDLTRPEKRPI